MKGSLNTKYQFANIFYFAVLASMLAFISNYLLHLGYSNATIGVVMSLYSILCVFGQPALADFAERHPKIPIQAFISVCLLLVAILSAVLYFAGLVLHDNIIILVLVVAIFTLTQCVMPMFNTLAFMYEQDGIRINYGVARGLGSAAYAVVSMSLGYIIKWLTPSVLPVFYVIFTLATCAAVRSFVFKGHKKSGKKEKKAASAAEKISFAGFVKKYFKFILFLTGFMLMYADHMLINNFYIQVITSVGGTSSDMGIAIFMAAMLELPAMFSFSFLTKKFGINNLLRVASIFFILKHILTYMAGNMAMLYIAACMQALAYAIFIPGAVYYVNEVIDTKDQLMGQSVNGMFMTLGGVVASLIGGVLLDSVGVKSALLIGAIISVIGGVIVFMNLENKPAAAK